MIHIADKVEQEQNKKNSVLVLGLDPDITKFPQYISKIYSSKGSVADAVAVIEYFCLNTLDWLSDFVLAVKPQLAYFERYGSRGLNILEKILIKAREKGLLIIMDAKRGDIDNTSRAYADAFLGEGPLRGDFVTVNPYLGSDGYKPFIEKANAHNRGVFILLKTSNPSSKEIQDLNLSNGNLLYEHLLHQINQLNLGVRGNNGYSNVGFVVGATHNEAGKKIRKKTQHNLLLVPGYGAQGGSAKDVAGLFKYGFGAMVNSSRSILYPYLKSHGWEDMSEEDLKNWQIKATVNANYELKCCLS